MLRQYLGYPGEGWIKRRRTTHKRRKRKKEWWSRFGNLSMTTWNTRSMTMERFDYCKRLGYDVLAVTGIVVISNIVIPTQSSESPRVVRQWFSDESLFFLTFLMLVSPLEMERRTTLSRVVLCSTRPVFSSGTGI